jgi:putative oxidoreductase
MGLAIRLVLGTAFLWSGASKMSDLGEFADAIRLYRLIPGVTAGAAARLVAWIESALGTALLVGLGVTWASRLGIGLLAIFTVAIGINLVRGRRIPCGCRRNSTEPIQVKHILRNSAALLALAYLAGLPVHRWAIDSFLSS